MCIYVSTDNLTYFYIPPLYLPSTHAKCVVRVAKQSPTHSSTQLDIELIWESPVQMFIYRKDENTTVYMYKITVTYYCIYKNAANTLNRLQKVCYCSNTLSLTCIKKIKLQLTHSILIPTHSYHFHLHSHSIPFPFYSILIPFHTHSIPFSLCSIWKKRWNKTWIINYSDL